MKSEGAETRRLSLMRVFGANPPQKGFGELGRPSRRKRGINFANFRLAESSREIFSAFPSANVHLCISEFSGFASAIGEPAFRSCQLRSANANLA